MFKKMEYDCERQGCFNQKRRLDFSVFYDCLPGKISFSDVDGICEINGYFLMLEWKEQNAPLRNGAKTLLYQFCKNRKCMAIVCWGHAERMQPEKARVYCNGAFEDFDCVDQGWLKTQVEHWAYCAGKGLTLHGCPIPTS